MKITTPLIIIALMCNTWIGRSQISYTLATDANSYVNSGYSLEGGLNYKKMRFSMAINQLEIPEYINFDYETFTEYRKSLDFTITRFLNEDQNGFHFGIRTSYVIDEETNWLDTTSAGINNSLTALNDSYLNVGVTMGYFWFPFKNSEKAIKGLFIEPTVGLIYHINKDDLLINNQIIEQKPVSIDVPRLNIGWKFEL